MKYLLNFIALKKINLKKNINENNAILKYYNPDFMNKVSYKSKISYINGDKRIIEYHVYPIEKLSEKSLFIQVAFLIIFRELPQKNLIG